MTILSVAQNAAVKLNQRRPTELFSATAALEIELRTIANDAVTDLVKSHEWRLLTTLQTMAGDGTTTAFNLPADYDRMLKAQNVYSTRSQLPLTPVRDMDQWMEFQIQGVFGAPGFWIILNGQMSILPVLGASENGKYYYISNLAVAPNAGANKAQFTADTDTFRLSEKLLELEIVWRWRAQKGLEYSEALKNCEILRAQVMAEDRGSRVLAMGRGRVSSDAQTAYPGVIVA